MCEKAVEDGSWHVKNVPYHFKSQEMCEKAVVKDPWGLYDVPDHFKTKRMHEKAIEKNPLCLEYVPDHFLRHDCLEDDKRWLLVSDNWFYGYLIQKLLS